MIAKLDPRVDENQRCLRLSLVLALWGWQGEEEREGDISTEGVPNDLIAREFVCEKVLSERLEMKVVGRSSIMSEHVRCCH